MYPLNRLADVDARPFIPCFMFKIKHLTEKQSGTVGATAAQRIAEKIQI